MGGPAFLVHLHDTIPQVSLQDLHSLLLQVLGEEDLPGGVGFGLGHYHFSLQLVLDSLPCLQTSRGHDHFYPVLLQVRGRLLQEFLQVVHCVLPDVLHPFFQLQGLRVL